MATGFTADGMPSRPYASPDQLSGETPRTAELQRGIAGDPDNIATVTTRPSAGLLADSAQWSSAGAAGYRPTSVLQPIMTNPGNLGMSAGDAAHRLPDGTFLGTGNGMAESSFEPAAMLKMSGLNSS